MLNAKHDFPKYSKRLLANLLLLGKPLMLAKQFMFSKPHTLILLLACVPLAVQAEWFHYDFEVMGTRASVELWADSNADAQKSFDTVQSEMQRIEIMMSSYIETSELSAINRHSVGKPLAINDELFHLIQKSLYFSSISDGAFDISYASVGHLYQYRDKVKPADDQVTRLLPSVDWRSIQLVDQSIGQSFDRPIDYDNQIIFAKPGMKIDLGGIAKGYAVDQSIDLLIAADVQSAIITAGGDSRMIGDRGAVPANDDGTEVNSLGQRIPWMVGIKHPRKKQDTALRLPLVDTAISTSGDYERYFFDGERRVHHIINPKTGYSSSGVVSASVIGPQSVNCDVLSTTLFVLGVERGLKLIETLDKYDAVMIDAKGKVHFSTGLAEQ